MNKKLQRAALKAAKQNFQRDVLEGLYQDDFDEGVDDVLISSWGQLPKDQQQIYIDEALYLLETTGENYLPDFKQHKHIVLQAKGE